MLVLQLLIYAFGLLFIAVGLWSLWRLVLTRTRGVPSKLRMLNGERVRMRMLAGEMNPPFYEKLYDYLSQNPTLKLELATARFLVIEEEDFDRLVDAQGNVRDADELVRHHPLFKLVMTYPERCTLRFMNTSERTESHFAIACGKGQVFVNLPHGPAQFRGGVAYSNDREVFDAKSREFDRLWNNPELCTPVQPSNLSNMLKRKKIRYVKARKHRR